jgi:hypothetical protein
VRIANLRGVDPEVAYPLSIFQYNGIPVVDVANPLPTGNGGRRGGQRKDQPAEKAEDPA